MRLIDADLLTNELKEIERKRMEKYPFYSIDFPKALACVADAPIAYDVDAVLEEVRKIPIHSAQQHVRILNAIAKGGVDCQREFMEAEEAKPCPFCGSVHIALERYINQDTGSTRWRIWCEDCMAMLDPGTVAQKQLILSRWNGRASNGRE